MPSQITLRVIQGSLRGQGFVFGERTLSVIGRGEGCYPRLPNDAAHRKVSRQHCLLDIQPPDIRVRDLGSLNGTYVNGQQIGQRPPHLLPGDEATPTCLDQELGVGDELTIGATTFVVDITFAPVCDKCWAEISADQVADCLQAPSLYECPACRRERPGRLGVQTRRQSELARAAW